MSDWKIKMDPNGDFEVVIDELKELDNAELSSAKMDYESGKTDLPPVNCRLGQHKWKWYEGLMERYWYCSEPKCDIKDFTRPAPPRKIR